jgi:hypothetical protein
VATVFEAWEATPFAQDLLEPIENDALEQAGRGRFNASELAVVGRRRFRRRGAEAIYLADRFAIARKGPSDEKE